MYQHQHHAPHFVSVSTPAQGGYAVSSYATPYVAGLQEGMIVRDKSSGAIYRLEGGRKRHYPNMTVYSGHGSPSSVDFDSHVLAAVAEGPNILPPGLYDEQVIRDPASGAIYKLINGKKSHYPNMDVYTSHGSPQATNIDSQLISAIVDGPAMTTAISEGSVVRDKKTGAIYRIINGKKVQYPNMAVYQAHGSPAFVDYDGSLLAAYPAEVTYILPPGFFDGQVVRNQQSGAIYRIIHGRKCHFPNPDSYAAHGSPAFTNFDASSLDRIPDGFTF